MCQWMQKQEQKCQNIRIHINEIFYRASDESA